MSGRLILNHQIYSGNRGRGYDIGLKDIPLPLPTNGSQNKTIPLAPGNARTRASRQAYAVWRRDLCRTITESPYGLGCFITVNSLIFSTYAPVPIRDELLEELAEALPGIEILLGMDSPSPKAVGAANLLYQSRFMVS